jgi:hypothetical protein
MPGVNPRVGEAVRQIAQEHVLPGVVALLNQVNQVSEWPGVGGTGWLRWWSGEGARACVYVYSGARKGQCVSPQQTIHLTTHTLTKQPLP